MRYFIFIKTKSFRVLLASFCILSLCYAKNLKKDNYEIIGGKFTQKAKEHDEIFGGKFKLQSKVSDMFSGTNMKGGDYRIDGIVVGTPLGTRPVQSNVSAAHLYPNPFDGGKGHTEIHITRLPKKVEISIYTVSGALVYKTTKDTELTDDIIWDLKNNKGDDVVSGIYLYMLKSANGVKTGKLIIIR